MISFLARIGQGCQKILIDYSLNQSRLRLNTLQTHLMALSIVNRYYFTEMEMNVYLGLLKKSKIM